MSKKIFSRNAFCQSAFLLTILALAFFLVPHAQAAGNQFAWPVNYCTDKVLVQIPGARDIYYGKLSNAVCYGTRVPTVAALQVLSAGGYLPISPAEAMAIKNQITINKSSLNPNSQDYQDFLASPLAFTVAHGVSVSAYVPLAEVTALAVPTTTTPATAVAVNADVNARIASLESLVNQLSEVIRLLATALGLDTDNLSAVSNVNTASDNTSPVTNDNAPLANTLLLAVDNGELILPIQISNSTFHLATITGLADLQTSLQTNPPQDSDFDNDGYLNLDEVINHYNPWGPGSLNSLSEMAVLATGITRVDLQRLFP